MQHQHPLLRLLPARDNIGARLAMITLSFVLLALVLGALALLEVVDLSPVDMRGALPVVAIGISIGFLFLSILLWLVIDNGVLHPLEQIRSFIKGKDDDKSLGQVAATMREMRDAIAQSQALLIESNKNLRHVEKLAMVGKLAAGVAHSVRNPLTSVNLRIFSLSKSSNLSEKQKEDFKVISDAVKHIDCILNNFLEFSKRPALSITKTTLEPIISASLQLLENKISIFPVSVTRKKMETQPQIMADPDQLREALLNILINACEAMDYSGTLTISEFIRSIDGKPFVHIVVQDTGPGIAEEDISEIFIPFFSTKDQGTGLGLPIAKGILEEHGGDIFVMSSAKNGTLFTLILPVHSIN